MYLAYRCLRAATNKYPAKHYSSSFQEKLEMSHLNSDALNVHAVLNPHN